MSVEVTQADRKLFRELYLQNPDDTDGEKSIEAGLWDDDWRMVEIARHRIAAEQAACAEMRELVEYLRDKLDADLDCYPDTIAKIDALTGEKRS